MSATNRSQRIAGGGANAIAAGADKEASQRRHHADVSTAEPGQCGESATAIDGGADTEQGTAADRQYRQLPTAHLHEVGR